MYPPRMRGRNKQIGWKQVDTVQKYREHVQMAACRDLGGIFFCGEPTKSHPQREAGKGVKYGKGEAINFYGRKLSLARTIVSARECPKNLGGI